MDSRPLSTVGFEPGSRRFTRARHLIVSNIKLPDGTFDQLALQSSGEAKAFERYEAVLVWVFHRELRRIWFAAAHRQAPITDLPDYLRRTFDRLIDGSSEKEVAIQLGLSNATVHGYVKQIYARLNVQSRGELLARFGSYDFVPRLGPVIYDTPHKPNHFEQPVPVNTIAKPVRFRVGA